MSRIYSAAMTVLLLPCAVPMVCGTFSGQEMPRATITAIAAAHSVDTGDDDMGWQ